MSQSVKRILPFDIFLASSWLVISLLTRDFDHDNDCSQRADFGDAVGGGAWGVALSAPILSFVTFPEPSGLPNSRASLASLPSSAARPHACRRTCALQGFVCALHLYLKHDWVLYLKMLEEFMPRMTEALVPRPPTRPNPLGTNLALTVKRSGFLFPPRVLVFCSLRRACPSPRFRPAPLLYKWPDVAER